METDKYYIALLHVLLAQVGTALELLIGITPTGDARNKLTSSNIFFKEAERLIKEEHLK